MNLYYQNEKLTIEEIISGQYDENALSDFEQRVFSFIRNWHSEDDAFVFETSGSTGPSKEIRLTRMQMLYSAKTSMSYLDPKHELKSAILCIHPSFVGGAMLLVRAITFQLDVYLVEPKSLPAIQNLPPSLISMVPMQVIKWLDHQPELPTAIQLLLIGGAGLPEQHIRALKDQKIKAYITYGMTETASHIALRKIQSENDYFTVLGDIQIDIDDRGCLRIRGTITNHTWLQTNDVVELVDGQRFNFIGRADLIINSGGFKVNPEHVESRLQPLINCPVLVIGVSDAYLGQKIVLLIESKKPFKLDENLFNHLHPYEKPKEIHFIPKFQYTQNGKIDRFAQAKLI